MFELCESIATELTEMPATLDKDDCERLIELVRMNEVIYDASHEDYKDAQLVQHVWTTIASEMGKNDLDGKYSVSCVSLSFFHFFFLHFLFFIFSQYLSRCRLHRGYASLTTVMRCGQQQISRRD